MTRKEDLQARLVEAGFDVNVVLEVAKEAIRIVGNQDVIAVQRQSDYDQLKERLDERIDETLAGQLGAALKVLGGVEWEHLKVGSIEVKRPPAMDMPGDRAICFVQDEGATGGACGAPTPPALVSAREMDVTCVNCLIQRRTFWEARFRSNIDQLDKLETTLDVWKGAARTAETRVDELFEEVEHWKKATDDVMRQFAAFKAAHSVGSMQQAQDGVAVDPNLPVKPRWPDDCDWRELHDLLAGGKYTHWMVGLSPDELAGLLWLVGEYAIRTPFEMPARGYPGRVRRLVASNGIAEFKRKGPKTLEQARKYIRDGMEIAAANNVFERRDVDRPMAAFVASMRSKLKENDHKGGWQDDSLKELSSRLIDEVVELLVALGLDSSRLGLRTDGRRSTAAEIRAEAADVGNFAMMIHDRFVEVETMAEDES